MKKLSILLLIAVLLSGCSVFRTAGTTVKKAIEGDWRIESGGQVGILRITSISVKGDQIQITGIDLAGKAFTATKDLKIVDEIIRILFGITGGLI